MLFEPLTFRQRCHVCKTVTDHYSVFYSMDFKNHRIIIEEHCTVCNMNAQKYGIKEQYSHVSYFIEEYVRIIPPDISELN